MSNLPDAVKRIADCVPGKRVNVTLPDGSFALGIPVQEPTTAERDLRIDAVELRQARDRVQLDELAATVAAMKSSPDRVQIDELRAAVAAMETAVASWAKMQSSFGETQAVLLASVTKLADILTQPVKPIYDTTGKLIGAQRVTALPGGKIK